MITDIDKYVDFLIDNKITEHQFLILWLVHTKDEANIKKFKLEFGQFNIDQITNLIDRGFIDDFGTIKDGERNFNIYNFLVSDKFAKLVIVDEEDAYQELVEVFPKWMIVKGNRWPMIKGDPYQNTKEYRKFHKNNKLVHQNVVNTTRIYFANNPPIGNIEEYIRNRQWNFLENKNETDVFKTM